MSFFDFNDLFRFWFIIILIPLSILCSLFVLYHLLFNRTLRQSLNNHVIIILIILNLVIELIDIPFILYFYHFGTTWRITVGFAQFWSFIDFGCYATGTILFAWATIERHILVFHDQWVSTKKKRFFFHYLPIISILTYGFIYYLTAVVFLACQDMIDQDPTNGIPIPCVYDSGFFPTWDLLCHLIIPTCIIVIFSLALLVRVLYQKARMHQPIQWRKQRKLVTQVLCITLLYQLFNFPWAFLQFCVMINKPIDADGKVSSVFNFLPYYLVCLFPFVCCGTLPELRKKLNKLFFWQRQQRVVGPITIAMNIIQSNRTFQKN